MTAQYTLALTFLTVTLLGTSIGVTDEEFQVGFISYYNVTHKICHSNC